MAKKSFLRRLADKYLTQEQKRFVKFGIVGSSGVAVNLLFVWLTFQVINATEGQSEAGTVAWDRDQAIASAVGILVSVFTNFLLNDGWTWGDREKGVGKTAFLTRVLRYYVASAFAEKIDLDGVVLTKLDGDARGGAALAVKAVTGVPIKFLGTGETVDRLEESVAEEKSQERWENDLNEAEMELGAP